MLDIDEKCWYCFVDRAVVIREDANGELVHLCGDQRCEEGWNRMIALRKEEQLLQEKVDAISLLVAFTKSQQDWPAYKYFHSELVKHQQALQKCRDTMIENN